MTAGGEPRRRRRVDADGDTVLGETRDISLAGVAVISPLNMTSEQFVKLRLGQLEGGFAVEFENVENNGSALEDRLRSMLGSQRKNNDSDETADERARLQARLMAMLGGGDDQ